jgi:hypothetical protein
LNPVFLHRHRAVHLKPAASDWPLRCYVFCRISKLPTLKMSKFKF